MSSTAPTTRHDDALAGFEAAVAAGVDMVMVSSAFYSKIDDEHRAAFSTMIIGEMLRDDLGFTGVVISDDMAAVAMRTLPPDERGLRFIRAGGDLLIIGDAEHCDDDGRRDQGRGRRRPGLRKARRRERSPRRGDEGASRPRALGLLAQSRVESALACRRGASSSSACRPRSTSSQPYTCSLRVTRRP